MEFINRAASVVLVSQFCSFLSQSAVSFACCPFSYPSYFAARLALQCSDSGEIFLTTVAKLCPGTQLLSLLGDIRGFCHDWNGASLMGLLLAANIGAADLNWSMLCTI